MTERTAPNGSKLKPIVTFRLERRLLDMLDDIATKRGTTRSMVIATGLHEWLRPRAAKRSSLSQEYQAQLEADRTALAWLDRIAADRSVTRSDVLATLAAQEARCDATTDLFD